ncbi:MAG: MMPL family transporter, partial [Pseudonocardiaceae bacterium]
HAPVVCLLWVLASKPAGIPRRRIGVGSRGTVVAALVPLALAGAGLLATFGVITVLAGWIGINQLVIAFVTMIGLGVGIDYAMSVVSRFHEELRRRGGLKADRPDHTAVADAVGTAMATSGRTIAPSQRSQRSSWCRSARCSWCRLQSSGHSLGAQRWS